MSKEKIYIFDTTLRDGAQTEGVNFSIDDKIKIAKALSDLGVDYLEGGWPGANTLDTTFFNNPPKLTNTILQERRYFQSRFYKSGNHSLSQEHYSLPVQAIPRSGAQVPHQKFLQRVESPFPRTTEFVLFRFPIYR